MSFKPIDGRRDDFRKYLERTGVLDAISKVFVKLVNSPERPENAIEFIRENLGDPRQRSDSIDQVRKELESARKEIAHLKHVIENLKSGKSVVATEDTEQRSNEKEEDSNRSQEKSPTPPTNPSSEEKEAVASDEAVDKNQTNSTQNGNAPAKDPEQN